MSNCKSFFNGYESRDSNCNSFNNRNMFDEFNGFTGYERGSFDGTRDRNFEYAKGRGSLQPLGGNPAQREVGGTNCGGKCGQHWGISCPTGCRCSSTLNGVCESATMRKKTPQQVAQREVADPTGYGCEDISCGSYAGGGRKRCPKGCKCKGGFCVSKNKREVQGGVTPAARQSDFFICPKGKCWNGSKCVPCTDGTPDAYAFSGRDMSNGGFRLR